MKASRIEKIKNYVKTKTFEIISSGNLENYGIDAINCALDLHFDRANVSKDLNILWKSGALIKAQGKPVYYFDYETLINAFPNCFFPSILRKNEKISNYIINNKENEILSNFEFKQIDSIDKMIGARGSIFDVILNAKSAIAYPPYGIHCIISGNHGVGKSYLASNMYDYAKKIHNNPKLPIMFLYCQNYEDNPSLFLNAIYGTSSKSSKKNVLSIFDQCQNGIIVFEQIEHLPYSCQNLLSSIINQKQYTTIDSNIPKQLNTMIIATTNLDINNFSIESLIQSIPIRLKLRDIDQRGIYEKIELILSLLSQEAAHTKKSICIHKDIVTLFAIKNYPNNISDMRNEIQIACSKAYLEGFASNQNSIYITYNSLSLDMLNLTESNSNMNTRIISLLSCIPTDYLQFDENGESPAFKIFQNAPNIFNNHRISQFVEEFKINVNDLDDIGKYVSENIAVLQNCPEPQLEGLKKAINPYIFQITMQKIYERLNSNIIKNNGQLLYGILLHITNYLNRIQNDVEPQLKKNENSVTEMVYHNEFLVAKEIYDTFGKTYGFTPSIREIDFLATYLAIATQWSNHTNVSLLVICHGDNIASELVNYIKSTIKGNYIIDAINYSHDMQINDCLELACFKATSINKGAGVLVICDFEPLTSIGDHIYKETGIPSRTITNITLSTLIQIVQKSMTSINSLDALVSNYKKENTNKPTQNDYLEQVRDKIISKTVDFIDTQKAINVLKVCLEKTLNDLSIPYSDSIAIKYICHCTNMLERIIRNEAWSYSKINKFYKENAYIMNVVEHRIEYAGNAFGVKIPNTEIVYVAEIFVAEKNIKSVSELEK